jgi:hypothetical protein
MRVKKGWAILFVTWAWTWFGARVAQAQFAPTPPEPANVIGLELSPLPLEQSPPVPAASPPSPPTPTTSQERAVTDRATRPIRPTPQRLDYRSMGGNRALKQLENPFEAGTSPEKRGLFGHLRSKSVPASGGETSPRGIGGPTQSSAAGAGAPPAPPPPATGPVPPESPDATPPGALAPGAKAPSPAPPSIAPDGGAAPSTAPGATEPPGAAAPSPSTAPAVPPAPDAATPGAGTAAAPTTTTGAAATSTADLFGGTSADAGPGFGGTLATAATPFAMIGDMSPLTTHAVFPHVKAGASAVSPPGPPPPPGARGGSPIFPSVRNFKISENQSPKPQDRVFFDFNYYNNLNDTLNRLDLSPITQMKAYIYNFGVEKTFNNGMGSLGVRVPLDNLTANSFGNIIGTPTSTSLGNMTIFAKYILAQKAQTGSLVSAGFAVTPQTGPGRFAGAPYLFPLNSTSFQPYLGYIYNHNRFYLQGFSGFSFSANPNDVSFVFNDVAIGYFVYRNTDTRSWLTALAPTVELHVDNPINHRDPLNSADLAGSPDSVNMTFGVNFGIKNSAVLTTAFVTPLASLKPFDSEAILMLNIFFGRSRAQTQAVTPPPL